MPAIIIPARLGSSRLNRKVLLEKDGKPLIKWVYDGCIESKLATHVCVATDSVGISQVCEKYKIPTLITSMKHENGTSRIAEVAVYLGHEIIINVQGDEPLVRGEDIDNLIEFLRSDNSVSMASLYTLAEPETVEDPNVVKVVIDRNQHAACFSRELANGFQHIGLYAFRRDFLIRFAHLKPTPNELKHRLEQLRALDSGYDIGMIYSKNRYLSIDTQDDYERWLRI